MFDVSKTYNKIFEVCGTDSLKISPLLTFAEKSEFEIENLNP